MEGEGKTTHVPSEQAKQIANGIFAKYDADHNGSIDMEEARPIFIDNLKRHKATKLTVTDAELHDWFEKADLNKDGVISVDEAAIFVDKYFLHH